ncbi:MAG: hypothetical protein D3903_06790 [Candidatus Electrothrix sp. GM3_4]|nr:hypothetical protein [Candidatus Electrothrix sp. GM3_4]
MKIHKKLEKRIFPEKSEHTVPGMSGSGCMKNEQGFVLVLSLMVLVVLTLLGISASRTSVIELEISGNDNLSKMLLYYAESAAYEAAQRLENIQGENEDCLNYPECLMFDQGTANIPWVSDADTDLDSVLENNSVDSKISPLNNDPLQITVDMVAMNRGRVPGESLQKPIPKAVFLKSSEERPVLRGLGKQSKSLWKSVIEKI